MVGKPAVLYISYDGMLEPLGQSQVLAYLGKLASDYRIFLISFEKKEDRNNTSKFESLKGEIAAAGIDWTPLPYHKTPSAPATAYDIICGAPMALWIALRENIAVVHTRSYPPALMAMPVKWLTRAKFLFDMRGFWADERVDGGLWPANGALYRVTKFLERMFFRNADHVVTLTHASAREIATFPYLAGRMPPMSVITTCADLDRFAPLQASPTPGPFTLGYVGSLGTWYLLDELMACFKLVVEYEPDAQMLVINRNEHKLVIESATRLGIDLTKIRIAAAEHREVPMHIAGMSAGAAIIKPAYSKMSSAPTKIAEYLGCGIPCLGNTGVGDVAEILIDNGVGVALTDFSDADRRTAVQRLLALAREPGIRQRCVDAAHRLFSLSDGVESYRAIYQDLTQAQRSTTDMQK